MTGPKIGPVPGGRMKAPTLSKPLLLAEDILRAIEAHETTVPPMVPF